MLSWTELLVVSLSGHLELTSNMSRRISVMFSTKDLEATRIFELESEITRKVGTHNNVQSRNWQKAGQRVATEEDRRGRGHVGREIRRRGLSEMEGRNDERILASLRVMNST